MRRGGHLIAVGPLAAQYFPEDAGVAVTPYSPEARKRLANCLTAEQWNRAAESLHLDPACYLSYNG